MPRPPRASPRAVKLFLAAVVLGALGACSTSRESSPAPIAQTAPSPGAPPSPGQAGPPVEPPDFAVSAPPPPPASADADPTSPEPPTPSGDDASSRRTDGRPEWWIDGALNAQGRITVAAEAMGVDVLSARRAAIDAARASLTRAIKNTLRNETIHFATVRPLPAKGGAPGGPKFVGYVLMSVETPTED